MSSFTFCNLWNFDNIEVLKLHSVFLKALDNKFLVKIGTY